MRYGQTVRSKDAAKIAGQIQRLRRAGNHFCYLQECLTPGTRELNYVYHLRSDSGSNGLATRKESPLPCRRPILIHPTLECVTRADFRARGLSASTSSG